MCHSHTMRPLHLFAELSVISHVSGQRFLSCHGDGSVDLSGCYDFIHSTFRALRVALELSLIVSS